MTIISGGSVTKLDVHAILRSVYHGIFENDVTVRLKHIFKEFFTKI